MSTSLRHTASAIKVVLCTQSEPAHSTRGQGALLGMAMLLMIPWPSCLQAAAAELVASDIQTVEAALRGKLKHTEMLRVRATMHEL